MTFFADGNTSLAKIDAWLRADDERDDTPWIISKAELGNPHDVIEVAGITIAMTFDPGDRIIVSR